MFDQDRGSRLQVRPARSIFSKALNFCRSQSRPWSARRDVIHSTPAAAALPRKLEHEVSLLRPRPFAEPRRLKPGCAIEFMLKN